MDRRIEMKINRISLGVTLVIVFTVFVLVFTPVTTGAKVQGVPNPAAVMASAGTAFTYQGWLTVGESPANGVYNFLFSLYEVETDGTPLGIYPGEGTIPIEVTDGYFITTLDFGDKFSNGGECWLEIKVGEETLSPRQPLTPTPYAIYAQNVGEHNHLGETWIGDGYPLGINNPNGDGFIVEQAGNSSYSVPSYDANGIEVWGADSSGLYVGWADLAGVRVHSAGHYGVLVESSDQDGMIVWDDGVMVWWDEGLRLAKDVKELKDEKDIEDRGWRRRRLRAHL